MKKLLLSVLLLTGIITCLSAQISPMEAVPLMQKGINLGNTLEPPFENSWNNPPAQEYYFDLYKEAGFQTVRIPVRWDEHTMDLPPYEIDETWMQRVEEVVDWGLQRGLFIVLNSHHDNWIKDNYDNPAMRARFDSVWSQISRRFSDRSDSLFFEVLNEPHGLTKEQNDDMHARILTIIREHNPTRIVIFQGHNWGGSDELLTAAIPDDDYLMGSFHSYDPWPFGLEGTGSLTVTDINNLRNKFIEVKNWSDINNIPVFLGEFGAHRLCEYNDRMKLYEIYVRFALEYGFVYCAWDDGGDFRIMQRQDHDWNEIKDILLHFNENSPQNPKASLYQDTIIQISWTNEVPGADSIFIERKKSNTEFKRIAALSGEAVSYPDEGMLQNLFYYYRIIAHFNDEEDNYSRPIRIFMPVYEEKVRELFYGYPLAIPGVIEAEDFDKGGEGLSYHDMDDRNIAGAYRPDEGVDIYDRLGDGYHIGNALPGEWYEYTVEVEKDANYYIDVYLASTQGGGKFQISIGDEESEVLTAPKSGSQLTTETIRTEMYLTAGEKILRFTVIDDPLFNFDKMEFTVNTTGYQEIMNKKFKVYQNAEGALVLHLQSNDPFQDIKVHDIQGRLVFFDNSSPFTGRKVIHDINPGIYIVSCQSGGAVFYRKIILQ